MNESISIALIGVSGAVIGSASTLAAQWLSHYLKERAVEKLEKPRKDILIRMLNSKNKWRKIETLMHVIGTNEENTKKLLLEIGARASEDGAPLWGLIERNPLPEEDR